jgi:hypothetical protein
MRQDESGFGTAERRSEDRRRVDGFHYPERRTGFDRRARGFGGPPAPARVLAFVRDRDAVLVTMLCVVNALNISDLFMTLHLLRRGAVEANLLMGALLGVDPIVAGAFKVITLAAVSLAIWRMRRYRSVLALAALALGGFATLFAYQLALLVFIA